jgi:hypothetical protein
MTKETKYDLRMKKRRKDRVSMSVVRSRAGSGGRHNVGLVQVGLVDCQGYVQRTNLGPVKRTFPL